MSPPSIRISAFGKKKEKKREKMLMKSAGSRHCEKGQTQIGHQADEVRVRAFQLQMDKSNFWGHKSFIHFTLLLYFVLLRLLFSSGREHARHTHASPPKTSQKTDGGKSVAHPLMMRRLINMDVHYSFAGSRAKAPIKQASKNVK